MLSLHPAPTIMKIGRLLPLVPTLLYAFARPPQAAGQSWISVVVDSAAAVRALAQLPPPDLPPGVPPFFALSFDSTGAPAIAEPLFRQLPAAYTAPVTAILRAHARPQPPGAVPHSVRLRVVTGPAAEIGPGVGEATDPALLNGGEIVQLLEDGARAVLSPGEMSAGRRVRVEFRVNDDGAVERDSVRLLMPSGSREMDSVAVAAVRRMRFRPATFARLPVPYWANQPLSVSDPSSAPPAEPAPAATLDGITFPVPASYRIVPALSGAHLAVFADAGSGSALFVATLPAGMHRTEAMERARRSAAAAAVWTPRAAEAWHALASYPVSPREAYHDRRMAYYGGEQVVVQLRRLLVGGREIVTGYAFPVGAREERQELYGVVPRTPSGEAGRASLRIVGALAGEPPVDDDSLARDGNAAPGPAGETPDPEERAVREAWVANRSADRTLRMALMARPYLEFLDDMRHLALHAPAAAIHAEPPVNQVYVLRLRYLVPAAQLRAMDARQLFGAIYDERPMDFWDYFSQTGSDIAHVSVRGDLAFVWAKRSVMPDVFRREDGVWREDFLHQVFGWESVYRMSVQGFMEVDRETQEAAVRTLIGRLTGRAAPPGTIWDPSPLPPP